MPWARVGAIAAAVATVLYAMLDSGLAGPEPAPWFYSVSLGVLGLLFGVGGWATWVGGQPERSPLLSGVGLGVGGYAVLRLLVI